MIAQITFGINIIFNVVLFSNYLNNAYLITYTGRKEFPLSVSKDWFPSLCNQQWNMISIVITGRLILIIVMQNDNGDLE